MACSGTSEDAPDTGTPASVDAGTDPTPDAAPGPDAATVDLSAFYIDAATAVCGALYRCCDAADKELYFAPFRGSELLAAWHDQLPPEGDLDEAGCRQVVAEMFAVTPFGDWITAAEAGHVGFDAAAFGTCVAALDDATCGDETRAALFDSTCLGFGAPAGGASQRSIFTRTAGVGTGCTPVRDGVGAAFYGTCDPTVAYCCYQDPDNPGLGCTYPFTGDGVPRAGTCAAVASPGSACSSTPPLVICATGVSCDSASLECVADGAEELSVGDPCIDEGFNLLGDCVDSYCDIFGSSQCEALKADGADCTAGYECVGGACEDSKCAPNTVCTAAEAG